MVENGFKSISAYASLRTPLMSALSLFLRIARKEKSVSEGDDKVESSNLSLYSYSFGEDSGRIEVCFYSSDNKM